MFTTNFIGGGNIHGRKLAPENAPYENCPREICPPPPIPQRKKTKERKLIPEKIIS